MILGKVNGHLLLHVVDRVGNDLTLITGRFAVAVPRLDHRTVAIGHQIEVVLQTVTVLTNAAVAAIADPFLVIQVIVAVSDSHTLSLHAWYAVCELGIVRTVPISPMS